VFQKPQILTWLMALAVAVGVPMVAHFCGIWIKQWPKPAWITGLKLFVTAAAVVGCLVGINVARQAYLSVGGISLGRQDEILEHAFLAINIFIFVSATVLSHFAHDENEELEILHKRVSNLDRKLDGLDVRVHGLDGQINRLKVGQAAEIQEIRAIIRELVSMYRGANLLARKHKDEDKAQIFGADPEVAVPAVDIGERQETSVQALVATREKRRSIQHLLV
jgi:hypothetical protein